MKRLLLFMLLRLSALGQTVPHINNIIFVDGSVNCLTSTPYPCTGAGVAAAAAAAGNGGTVYLPNKTITITSTGLNLTNLNNVTFVGTSAYASSPGNGSGQTGTVLQFNYTGAGTVGVDISGSAYLHFTNIVFSCGTSAANAPNVCFLNGRTSGSNGILNKLEDCMVVGFSPWIYYNYRGEQFSSIDTGYIEYGTSGVPVTFSLANTARITSPFVTLGGGASETVMRFTGGKSMFVSNATTSTAPNNYLIYLDEGSGLIQDVHIDGFVEQVGTNEITVGDTPGATGAIENVEANLHGNSASATDNTLVSIAGTSRFWNLRGIQDPINSTGGPALSFALFLDGFVQFKTNIANAFSGTTCSGSIIIVDQLSTSSCFDTSIVPAANSAGTGLTLTGVSQELYTQSSNFTLNRVHAWVNVTGNTTATVPHAIMGRWDVFNSGSGTVTLAPDSGTITYNGTTATTVSLAAGHGALITCDGTNCFAH